MARIVSAILLIPLIGSIRATPQETAEQILAKTGETYKNLKTYHFRGAISYEWTGEDRNAQTFLSSFQSFKGAGGKLRHQCGVGMSKVLASTDGTRSLLYFADKGQYQYSNSPDLENFIQKQLKLENKAWIFPIISLLDKYANLTARFHNPKLMSPKTLDLNGKPVNCHILQGVMEPSDIDAVLGNRKTELWIHKDRHVVLRETHTGALTDYPVKGENLTETVTFSVAEPNAAPPVNVFDFQTPQEAKEVKELFASGNTPSDPDAPSFERRAHPFYYELPFLAMKHFKLPIVHDAARGPVHGDELELAKFHGKYVVLDFWATWCAPCHKQMKDLEKILRQYKGKDLAVLGLNNEGLDLTRAFLKKHTSAYPMLIDVQGELSSLYGVTNLPTLILLDRSGNIMAKKIERQTYEQIDKLLKEAGL